MCKARPSINTAPWRSITSRKSPPIAPRIASSPWLDYLDGKNAGYVEQALRADLERLRKRVDGMRKDTTTPDTRLADDGLYEPFIHKSRINVVVDRNRSVDWRH